MSFRKKIGPTNLGQSMVETALVLPIVLLMVFGVFELGRVLFIFSALNNASRETARLGAATGVTASGSPIYLDCTELRQAARETAFLAGLDNADIQIAYDRPVSGTMAVFAHCGDTGLTESSINQGDRIVITVTKTVEPILPLLGFDGFDLEFATARTILTDIVIGPVECSDGVDNDGDGLVDTADDGCSSADDTTEAFCYALSVVGQPPEGGTLSIIPDPNCANRYVEDTQVTLTASPTLFYEFAGWTGSITTTDNPTKFLMDAKKDVIANFRRRQADLAITKSAPAPVYAGDKFSYEIQLTNTITDFVRELVITDTLPSEVTFDSATPPCSHTAGVVTCELVDFPQGGNATFTIDVFAPVVDAPLDITNTAVVTATYEEDPDSSNNIAQVVTTVLPQSDLAVDEKVASVEEAFAGDLFDYTITVGNRGPSVATGVEISDNLQPAIQFVSSADGCEEAAGKVTCPVGTLLSGETAERTFTVRAVGNARTTVNKATVDGDQFDPNSGNDTNQEDGTEIIGRADLELTKTGPGTVDRDVPFQYTLTVTNNGHSDAQDVKIVDLLPAGIDYQGAVGATCSDNSNTITCELGTVTNGETRIVTITVIATVADTFTNTATVESTTDDNKPDNNEDDAQTTVVADVVLSLSKRSSAATVDEDQPFAYTLVVTNNGDSDATGVAIADPLPAGVRYVGYEGPTGWTCDSSVRCTLAGRLDGRTSATITINVEGDDVVAFPVAATRNTATATAVEDTEGDSDSADVTITPDLDLVMNVTAPASVFTETLFSYVLTLDNSGPSEANDLTVTIPLDPDVTYDGLEASSGWNCSDAPTLARELICTTGSLGESQQATFTVSVISGSTAGTTVTVEGRVTAQESEYDADVKSDQIISTVDVE